VFEGIRLDKPQSRALLMFFDCPLKIRLRGQGARKPALALSSLIATTDKHIIYMIQPESYLQGPWMP
jgi:hypothetical protein